MPLVADLNAVLTILNHDRPWAAYAIGDLAPGFVGHCEWHAPADGTPALVLVYRGFDPPIVFAMGSPDDLRALFLEVDAPKISLHVRPEALAAMDGAYAPTHTHRLLRMVLHPHGFRPVPHDAVRRLGEADLDAVTTLYESGRQRGDGPTFFDPGMLQQGTFHGVWEADTLVSVAGTHLQSSDLRVCAVGNVYTRHDRRGRGLAAQVTSAVVEGALARGVTTIVLNVAHDNVVAQRVYERLGFESYCEFLEGEAARIG